MVEAGFSKHLICDALKMMGNRLMVGNDSFLLGEVQE
jgi:hypothetical protein